MGTTALLVALVAGSAVCSVPPTGSSHAAPASFEATYSSHTAPASFEDTYNSGVTFQEFLDNASRRKGMWEQHYEDGTLTSEARTRAEALTGAWRILAIAEDWCSDSVNTVPYLAVLADAAPAIELRVINSETGSDIMAAHLTPDGRPSTPTIIVLDDAYEEVGCWVERPYELQAWALENKEALGDEFLPQKMAWYRDDAGRSTIDEVLGVIEAAAAGGMICEKG